jgi:hypothetical protein
MSVESSHLVGNSDEIVGVLFLLYRDDHRDQRRGEHSLDRPPVHVPVSAPPERGFTSLLAAHHHAAARVVAIVHLGHAPQSPLLSYDSYRISC